MATALKTNSRNSNKGKAQKGEMWRAPSEILAKYCCMDADSTWQLYHEIFKPVMAKFRIYQPQVVNGISIPGYEEIFNETIKMSIIQMFSGFPVDEARLRDYKNNLNERICEAESKFLNCSEVIPHISTFNEAFVNDTKTQEPEKFKKVVKPDEPKKFTQKMEISKTWSKWNERWSNWEGPPVSGRWLQWEERMSDVVGKNHFNLSSNDHKAWLFYDALKFPKLSFTDDTKEKAAIDSDALMGFGEAGKLLIAYNDLNNELSKIESTEKKLLECNDGRVHLQMKCPGTFTGRLSGSGGWNPQNQVKTRGYLECFIPREGTCLFDFDIQALEPVTLTESSRDRTMLSLYGPDAKANDIYLFNAVKLGVSFLSDPIRAVGYNPDNPTKEGIGKAKKECKMLRGIAKCLVLSCIAEGELVRVKDRGWIPIDKVMCGMSVWDGYEWVHTDGAVFMGNKTTIEFNGISMTKDHEVLTNDGWQISERAEVTQCFRPILPSYSWSDVWRLAGSVLRNVAGKWL